MSVELSRPLDADVIGTQVRVFRNLSPKYRNHKVWSVWTTGGRLIGHATAVSLRHATPHVSVKGRARTLATGRKQVHAWVQGTLHGFALDQPDGLTSASLVSDCDSMNLYLYGSRYPLRYRPANMFTFQMAGPFGVNGAPTWIPATRRLDAVEFNDKGVTAFVSDHRLFPN